MRALRTTAHLGVTVLLVMGYRTDARATETVMITRNSPVIPVLKLRGTPAPGVVHHHHHHVVVLQGGASRNSPPSKATMSALLQLPRQLLGQQLGTMAPPHSVFQSVSTLGGGVTHQYHFHSAHDLQPHAQPQPPGQQVQPSLLDPDAEWYTKQQSARVGALIHKLRDLGVHVDEVHANSLAGGKDEALSSTAAEDDKQGTKDDEQDDHRLHQLSGFKDDRPGGPQDGSNVDGTDQEQVRKELLKFISKIQKKQKQLQVDHQGWSSRVGVTAADFLAGGDLDVDVTTPQTVYDELMQLGVDLGVQVGLPT